MVKIVHKKVLNPSVTLLEVEAPLIAKKAKAGQFIILRLDEQGERIPLTIADYDREKGTVTIIFQKVGLTTELLAELNEGDSIRDFVGPLGLPTELPEGAKRVCVVGGGVGCAIAYPQAKTCHAEGLEVDVARELAARLKGDANALEIVGVNVTTRGAMLDNGTLDATLATFTITDARKKTYDFSRPYYIDHIGVLVLKKSGITDLSGLDGKTVGVALSATTKDKLGAAAARWASH